MHLKQNSYTVYTLRLKKRVDEKMGRVFALVSTAEIRVKLCQLCTQLFVKATDVSGLVLIWLDF